MTGLQSKFQNLNAKVNQNIDRQTNSKTWTQMLTKVNKNIDRRTNRRTDKQTDIINPYWARIALQSGQKLHV